MVLMLSCVVTRELLGRVLSGVIWAKAQLKEKANVCNTASPIALPITNQLPSANFQHQSGLHRVILYIATLDNQQENYTFL